MKKISEIKVTPELLNQISECANAEDLVKLAATHDISVSLEEAKQIIDSLGKELTDAELKQVTGGWWCSEKDPEKT